MSRNEVTSPKIASIAARYLRTGEATAEELRMIAASVLTQTEDQPKPAEEASELPGQ